MIALNARVHLFARPGVKDELRRCMTEVLGCAGLELDVAGPQGTMLAFRFPKGGSVSVEFVEDALDDERGRRGAWLEVVADDPEALKRRVAAAGLRTIQHPATTTFYFALPGGQVVGIAGAPGTELRKRES